MKKTFLILASVLCLLASALATPFFYKGYFADGTLNSNLVSVTIYQATGGAPQYSVYGTNIVYGGKVLTLVPDATAYTSNWLFPGRFRCTVSNLNASFIVNVPDTTNFLSLALYMENAATVSSGVGLNSYQLITNLLGKVPVDAAQTNQFAIAAMTNAYALSASLGTIASRASNDFFLVSSAGTIAGRASNDFALASSVGPIAIRSTNDFALAASLGTMALRSTNDFAMTNYDGLSQTISNLTNVKVITNGALVFIAYKTNGVPGSAFTNYPPGSLMATTNGGMYRLTNSAWQPLAL